MALVCALLAASLCVITGAQKADLNTNQTDHNVCDSHCAIEDLSAVTTKFSRQVTVKKARVVNFTISIRTDSKKDPCQNTSLQDFSLIWAVDEMEPHLYLPSDFLNLSWFFAPEFRYRMNIRLNCTRMVRRAPHDDEPSGTSLLEAAMRNLMQDLMQTSEGTLCFPLESQEKIYKSYKCCQLDESTSGIMCNVVHSKFVRWLRMLDILRLFILFIMFWYLPAVYCIFPDLPKVSKGGIRCIKLEDPSPASFRSLVVKACVSQNMPPLLSKTRDFLFKVVLYPCMFAFPLIIAPGFDFNVYIVLGAAGLYCAYVGKSLIIEHFVCSQGVCNSECPYCKKVFSQSVIHSSTGDAMKAHMSSYPFICMVLFREFHFRYYNWFKSHVYFVRLRFDSLEYTIWSVCRIFCFAVVVLLIAIPVFIFGCALILVACLVFSSPIFTLVYWNFHRMAWNPGWDYCDFAPFDKSYSHIKTKTIYLFVLTFTYCGLQWWTMLTSLAWVTALPYSIMAAIDYGDTALPILALLFLILYYLYSCFTSFSEKYQLLKIKLSQGIEQYHASKGSDESEDSLFVYTINGAMAIPEDLYEAACKELGMSIMEDLWVAFMKIVCFMVFVGSVYISIKIFGARSGIGPVTKAVAIFLAGFFPKLFTVLSNRENEQTLQEFEMEKQLKTVITRYAHERTSKRNKSGERQQTTTTKATAMLLPISQAKDTVTEK